MSTDRYVSMKHGPVLSNVLNLISFGSLSEKAGSWSSLIFNPSGYDVSLEREISEEDFEELSVAERKLLDEIWGKYGGLDEWELVDLLHDVGEWQDPHGTSVPISYSEILRAGGRSEDFIAAVEGELSAVDRRTGRGPTSMPWTAGDCYWARGRNQPVPHLRIVVTKPDLSERFNVAI